MLAEFKKFAMNGSVLDMAIGIIIGGVFTPIAKSLVGDVIMPPIGLLVGNVDFSELFFILSGGNPTGPYETLAEAQAAGAVTINYGLFLNTVFTFLVVAFSVFLLVKGINRWRESDEKAPAAPSTKDCNFCATAIPIAATRCPNCTSSLEAAA